MLKVLLITGSSKNKWYSNLVGYVVPLLAIEATEYKSAEPAGWINFVSKRDAEVIEIDTCKVNLYAAYIPEH